MRKTHLLETTALVALLTSAAAIAPAASAQEGPAAAPQSEVIIVTATRRAEDIQNIPINIAAVGETQIEEQGFDELADVLAYVPGISIVDRGGRQGNPVIVRGLNVDALGSGDGNNDGGGTVATYLGEIPVFVDLKLNDMERIEVLLGPQGTLYGAGTLGGAIRYIPKRPQFDGFELSVRGEGYQYSEAESISSETGFTFNAPLGDTFAVRGSLDYRNDSGFIDYPFVVQEIGVSEPDPDFDDPAEVAANLRRIEDADSEETLSGRLALRWNPVSFLDGVLTYYHQDSQIGGRRLSSARSTVPAGEYEAGLRVPEPNRIKNELLALEVTADLGFAELTSASGYSRFGDKGQRDQTDLLVTLEYSYESFPTFTAFTYEDGMEERVNQELRLVSTHGGPLSWIVGAFYNELDAASLSAEFTPGYADFAGFDRPDDLEYFQQGRSRLTESAFFGEIGYELTDRLTLTLGGRYYEYELNQGTQIDFPLFDPGFVAPDLDQIESLAFDPDLNQQDDGVLGKINLAYQATDDILVYATVSEGYRTGASNGVGECPEFDPDDNQQGACALAPGQEYAPGGPGNVSTRDERQYGPDKTTNYEVGFKSTWLNGGLTVNGATYYIEWSDPQVTSATVNASIPITINADGAESKGLELSGAWQATDNLSLRGSFSRTSSRLTAPVASLVRTITTPGFGTAFVDGQKGDRLPGSPELQWSAFATYDLPLANGHEMAFNLGYAYQSDVLTTTGGRGDSLTLDGYGMANASVVYDGGPWTATLFASNLFDEYAETGVRVNSLYNQTISGANVRSYGTYVAPPRVLGVRLAWDIM